MRILAAIPAALLASGALAQTSTPATPAPEAAPAAAPAPAPKKEEPKSAFGVFADKSKITINGRAWVSFENIGADAGTAGTKKKDRLRVTNDSSYLRLKAETALFADVKAWAQVEAQINMDGSGASPFDGTRNTAAGLASDTYGSLWFGRWDSPTKEATIRLDPFVGTGAPGYYSIIGQQAATAGTDNFYDARFTNSVMYASPTFQGLSFEAAYVAGETHNDTINPNVFDVGVYYENGPVYLAASYQSRKDCGNPDGGACAGSLIAAAGGAGTDTAIRVGGAFNIKQTFTRLSAMYEKLDSKADATATAAERKLARDAYFASITQGLGTNQHQLIFAYGLAANATGNYFTTNDKTGASYFTAAYRYWPIKTVDLYAYYTQLANKANGIYKIGSKGIGIDPGATTTAYGVGMRYMF